MVKRLFFVFSFITVTYGMDTYERNCVTCHEKLPATLQEMFKKYLLVYGGEMNVKAGIRHYLRYPSKDISVMSNLFIETTGIKKETTLPNKELDEAVDIYWEKFKVFGKLR